MKSSARISASQAHWKLFECHQRFRYPVATRGCISIRKSGTTDRDSRERFAKADSETEREKNMGGEEQAEKKQTPVSLRKEDVAPPVVPPVSSVRTTPASWGEPMTKEEWERISKLRMPSKPPASLGVYYEQDGRGMANSHGQRMVTGLSSANNVNQDLDTEQTEALLTATYASPLTSQPSSATVQPSTHFQESGPGFTEVVVEREKGKSKETQTGKEVLVETGGNTSADKIERVNGDEGSREEIPK